MKSVDDWRDKPLSCHWNVKYSALREMIPLLPEDLSERMKRVVASIVAYAMIVAAAAPSREVCQRISYSRRKAFYSAAKRYMGHDYSYAYVVAAVDMLVERGVLADHLKAKGGNFKPHKEGELIRYQSSFRPGDYLFGRNLPEIVRRKAESIRMKDSQGNLIDFRETERVRREKAFLDEVNRVIGAAQIEIDVAGAMKAGTLIHFPARSDRRLDRGRCPGSGNGRLWSSNEARRLSRAPGSYEGYAAPTSISTLTAPTRLSLASCKGVGNGLK
jgi:hypothetical protein